MTIKSGLTMREKWRVRLHSFGWLCQIFLSFTLSLRSYSEIGPGRHFNSKHAGVGGRGVNHLFEFYGQGAFASKLPEPDGQIKGNGRKGCLLLKRSFKSSFSFPFHLSLLLAKESWTLIIKVPGTEGKTLWLRALVPQLHYHLVGPRD